MNVKPLFVLSFLLVPLLASASFTATDTRRILAEQKDIRAESERPLGKYSRFNDTARARLHRAQDTIFTILAEDKSLEQLSKGQQVDLMNAVEEVKAVLAENEKDKLECWRERKTGTTMKTTICETVAQRERIMQDAREWKGEPGICGPVAGKISCGQVR